VRGEGRVEILGDREPDVADVLGPKIVLIAKDAQQLQRPLGDGRGIVRVDGRRAANAANERHEKEPASRKDFTKVRRASGRVASGACAMAARIALPTATPSATPRSAPTCAGVLMPKPTAIGNAVWARTRDARPHTSAPRPPRARVPPVS